MPIWKQFFAGAHDGKIVGGNEVQPENSVPWQVSVGIGNSFCGGSIISANTILTAAHCVDGNFLNLVITAGDHKRSDTSGKEQKITACSSLAECRNAFKQHPEWNASTLAGDVALIFLPESLTFNEWVQPVPLDDPNPDAEDLYVDELLTITGWGKTSDRPLATVSDILNTVTVPGISTVDCAAVYGSIITKDIICVDTTGGKGSCSGDSGGPMTAEINGRKIQVGIVSFGASAGCTRELPAGFSRIASYRDWIDRNKL